ncbi:trimethylamine methyltransferase family protein [Haloarculaceae archaeon H-GB2-1]|nr:trimethylamine methyltransferase family protein [Haloarculaceae archaeon H-GB2-1]
MRRAGPSSFTVHARNPENDVTIGEGGSVAAPAFGPPNVATFEDGRRNSTLADYEDLIKLTQLQDQLQVASYTTCEPHDVDQAVKHLEMISRSLTLTDKPVMSSNYGADRAKASLEMAGIVHDDPDLSEPYVIGLANSVPPRRWDARMAEGLMVHARHGQPIVVSPTVMSSASGPAPLAGTFALENANILFGITLAQLTNPGTPVVYGPQASNIDVRYGSFATAGPERALSISFTGQMGEFYDVPTRAGGGLTDSKTVDDQAGAESMWHLDVTTRSGVDFVIHAAGVLDSYSTVSPEKLVLDCERLRYLERYREGYDLSEDAFALDLIRETDPDDHFLNERHTLTHSKSEYLFPELYTRKSYDDWTDAGSKDGFEAAHERVVELLAEYERPELDPDVRQDLDAFVEEAKADIQS